MKPTSLIDSASAWTEPILGSDRLSHEIFSILESRFLFGPDETLTLDCCGIGGRGRVRILSIDGGGGGGELAAAALARLEARLRELSGNPSARIVDFFDLAAGSGAGAILAAALFAGGGLFAADAAAALALIQSDDHDRRRRWLFGRRSRGGGGSNGAFERVFGDATMRDAAKPLLIPCYDAATGAPYVFSRADAAEGDSYDFFLRDVCAAAYGSAAAAAAVSVDGATRVLPAPAMATAMASPAAAAVTHVLHNKREFPFVAGFGDLLVVSVGNGRGGCGGGDGSAASASETAEDLLRIAGAAQADMVDQALAFAFGESRSAANYVRIQGDSATAGRTLAERSVESVLFRGRRTAQTTNGERLDWAAGELVNEEERRRRSKTPTVLIKPPAAAAAAAVTPRTSSSASSEITTVTTVSGASSASL